jgi:hypothetical protein
MDFEPEGTTVKYISTQRETKYTIELTQKDVDAIQLGLAELDLIDKKSEIDPKHVVELKEFFRRILS